jgi:hypothetical protein
LSWRSEFEPRRLTLFELGHIEALVKRERSLSKTPDLWGEAKEEDSPMSLIVRDNLARAQRSMRDGPFPTACSASRR